MRAEGALTGLAIGDALGMPTQSLPRERIRELFGRVDRLLDAPDEQPIAPGLAAGHVTDDTEQALLLARLLVAGGGRVAPGTLAAALADWEDGMRARGSLDLLGPSTRAAVAAIRAGADPRRAGANGTTNGAAMRIAPVGVLMPVDDLTALVDRVAEVCLPTHGTSVAIAGAAAVAAAVSAGIAGAGLAGAVDVAAEAAALGAHRGRWVAAADVGERIRWAAGLRDEDRIAGLVGTSLATQESVPAAFAVLALHPGDPWAACCTAASLGGDTDTIGAMAGAIGGAIHGVEAFPGDVVSRVVAVNGLDLGPLAVALTTLRCG